MAFPVSFGVLHQDPLNCLPVHLIPKSFEQVSAQSMTLVAPLYPFTVKHPDALLDIVWDQGIFRQRIIQVTSHFPVLQTHMEALNVFTQVLGYPLSALA
jgi:hypothetical protein